MMHEYIINNIIVGEIKKSDINGFGLFAIEDIMERKILCNLDGQLVPWSIFQAVKFQEKDNVNNAYNEWNAVTEDLLLCRQFRTKYSFINHSRNPNCVIHYSLDEPGNLIVVSLKFIPAGEELTLDYRLEPLNKEYINGHGSTYL